MGEFSGGEFSQGENFPGENSPWGIFLVVEFSRGEFSQGWNFSGGNFPRRNSLGGVFRRGEFPQNRRTPGVSMFRFSQNLIGIKTGKSQESIRKAMAKKGSVPGCLTKHATGERGTVFELPKDKDNQIKSLSLLNRNDLETQKHVFVSYKHFANYFVKKNYHHSRLICSMNASPTILPVSQQTTNVSEVERERLNTKTPRKSPTARVLQPDELQRFKQIATIQNLEDIDNTGIISLGEGLISLNGNCHIIIFKLETNISNQCT